MTFERKTPERCWIVGYYEPYTGWRIVDDATTIEQLGWTEIADPIDPAPFAGWRKFVKIGGSAYDFIWQPPDVGIVALAYRIGYSDGAMRLLDVRPRYEIEDASK